MASLKADVLAAICALFTPASAGPFVSIIETRDVLKLEGLSRDAASPDERTLANGAALSLRHQDEAALAILIPLAQSAQDNDIRAGACLAMADVRLRQSRWTDLHTALTCAQDQSGRPLTGEARQALEWSDILSREPAMRLALPVSGALDARRDSAGMIRVRVAINGHDRDAIIDTDSTLPALSESAARQLGVRVLERATSILTSTRPDLPMRLGVADELKFGEAKFTNVVFAVLPDWAVRFGADYRMDAVVGLPIMLALGRIELAREGGALRLYYGARPGAVPAAELNLIVSGWDPFVLVKADDVVLRLALDTADDKTTLNATALAEYPSIGADASKGWAHWEGGGGATTDYRARTIPELTLSVAGRPVVLKQVKVLSSDERDRHGQLGQDALRRTDHWVLDFVKMTFAIGD